MPRGRGFTVLTRAVLDACRRQPMTIVELEIKLAALIPPERAVRAYRRHIRARFTVKTPRIGLAQEVRSGRRFLLRCLMRTLRRGGYVASRPQRDTIQLIWWTLTKECSTVTKEVQHG